MKKKNYLLIIFTLFFSFFLYREVSAATVNCSYKWNEETIILVKDDFSSNFNRIVANINISYAKDNEFNAPEGSCPSVYFYHGTDGNKIYSSYENCLNDSSILHQAGYCNMIQPQGTLTEGNQSAENIVGKSQATLVDRTNSSCTYETKKGNVHQFSVTNSSGQAYSPSLSCKSSNPDFCALFSNSNGYFYGGGNVFKCPTYIYYECQVIVNHGTELSSYTCNIIGVGGNEDQNTSDVENGITGDEPTTDSKTPPIEIKPLNCSGLFSNSFGNFLFEAYKLIKFAVPILIIGLSIVDFIKALSSQDESEVKKASSKLVKRLVIGVLIFVLPMIIEYLLGLAGIKWGTCDIK